MATNELQNAEATRKSAEVKEWELDYSLKIQPLIAFGKMGIANNELCDAKELALYEPNQLIYIAELCNSRIQVVTFEGDFVTNFRQDILKEPSGIAVAEYHFFVTDRHRHALLQFSDFKIAMTGTRGSGEGELDHPMGLCTDQNGDVYVADCWNNRVCIFSKELKFLNCLGAQQLILPVAVKVTPNNIVVLDNSPNCIHFYSRSGHLMNSCVDHSGEGELTLWNPGYFCLDPAGNILITDYTLPNIKIFSRSGELIHTLGKEGHGRGDLYLPFGICISELGTIFVLSFNRNFCLQLF